MTIKRIIRERFCCYGRISQTEFENNIRQIEERPWNLHIELTNACNANCVFCVYQFQTRKKVVMSDALFHKALNDYCSIGGGELRLESCVGDPLVDPHFINRVKIAKARSEIQKITVITNGINLDGVGIENILCSGIDYIGVSTGPWVESLYRSIYRYYDYQRVRKNITELLLKNAELGQPAHIVLLFRSNLSMRKTLAMPDYKCIKHIPHDVEFNTDFDTWLGVIKQSYLPYGMRLRPRIKHDREPCYSLYDGPIVFADGTVGLCSCRDFNADSDLVIGNISEKSLLELWQSTTASRLRRHFWSGDFANICKKCTAYANLNLYRTKRGSIRAQMVAARYSAAGNIKTSR